MAYLLDAVYLLLLVLLAPWLLYQSLRTGKYREGYGEKLLGRVPALDPQRPRLWLHAVSVGEVNLLAPLLAELRRRRPDWECVVSTTTQAGMALARKKYPELACFYCPLDFSWAVETALRRVCPRALVLAELELWPNLIARAKRRGVAVAVINGRLSEKSFQGYCRVRPLLRGTLATLDLVAVQDETYAERFRHLGARPEAVRVTGSIKFDGARSDRGNPATQRLAALAGIRSDEIVFLAGSTQEPEEAIALEVFQRLAAADPRLRLVIVPRHPERFESVARILETSGVAWQRRTQLAEAKEPAHSVPQERGPRVLLVDVVGELGAWWGTANIGFVGGSLGRRGGQNMIEPAAYGVAVCFGPNTWNFRDIVGSLLQRDAAVVVRDAAELEAFVARCLGDAPFAADLGRRAQEFVREQQGAATRTVDLLEPILQGVAAVAKQ